MSDDTTDPTTGRTPGIPSGPADDPTRTADEVRRDALPEGSPLRPGLAAQTVDPATGEQHTGQDDDPED